MLPRRDERRCHDGRIAGALEMQAVLEQLLLIEMAAVAGDAIALDLDRREHAVPADVRDVARVLEREHRVLEIRRELASALKEGLVAINVERCQASRAGRRVRSTFIATRPSLSA